MQDKIIFQMLDTLRGTFRSQQESLEVALLILAWLKLSAARSIPEELRLTAELLNQPANPLDTLIRLGETGALQLQAFAEAKRHIRLSPNALRPALDLALRLGDAGLIQEFDATDAICALPQSAFEETALPPELASLLVALGNTCVGDSVYTPWDNAGQLAARAAKNGTRVYLETPRPSTVPALVSILAKNAFEVHHADPIRSPSAVEGGKPRKFDVAVALTPLNERSYGDVAERDLFGRFPEQTTSGSVLAVRHLLSQTRRRVVAAVPSTLLFSTGVEQVLREDLVRRGIVEAVIQLPDGLFTYSNFPFAVLILDPAGGHDQIKFINANSVQFRESVSKARFRLVNLEKLAEFSCNHQVSEDSAIVSTADVLAKDAQLVVRRYVLSDTTKRIFELISTVKSVEYRDVVATIRPMPTISEIEGAVEGKEIGAADLPPFGYINAPGRPVFIDPQVAENNVQQFLRPFDIVLIIKGSVRKTGIVPSDVPPPGPGGWVAGQSAIVLRAKKDAIDPRALAIQMRSPVGQEVLRTVVSGATIPLIQLKLLMNLPVFVPDSATAQRAVEALGQETNLQREIDRLRQAQAEVAKGLWTL
jgi:type I restriction enzyme M protein